MNPDPEHWTTVYREAPEVFDVFARAEDADGAALGRLRELAGIEDRTVLEIGSGTGRATRALAHGTSTYIALEPRAGMARLGSRDLPAGAQVVRARGQALPLATRSIDVVIATWIMADLTRPVRTAVFAEVDRVAKENAGVWLLENHWSGEFQTLRGYDECRGRAALDPLVEECDFELIETVETELRFSSNDEAERVLGTILGTRVRRELALHPRANIGMTAAILHRAAR